MGDETFPSRQTKRRKLFAFCYARRRFSPRVCDMLRQPRRLVWLGGKKFGGNLRSTRIKVCSRTLIDSNLALDELFVVVHWCLLLILLSTRENSSSQGWTIFPRKWMRRLRGMGRWKVCAGKIDSRRPPQFKIELRRNLNHSFKLRQQGWGIIHCLLLKLKCLQLMFVRGFYPIHS